MIKNTNCTEIKVKKLPVTSGSVAAFTRFSPPLTTGNVSKKRLIIPIQKFMVSSTIYNRLVLI